MWVRKLEISRFRNIEHASLSLNPHINLIVGNNGSGKSSILEALHCLSSGQSFRTNKSLPIIATGSQESIIYGETASGGAINRVGIKKTIADGTLIKLDGKNLNSQSELALLIPIVGISPEGDDLLEGSSKSRLSYLDWSLFHVEQPFRELWRSYRRAVKQRNSALRSRMSTETIHSWSYSIAESGEKISLYRTELLQRIAPLIQGNLAELLSDIELSIAYRRGWSKEMDLKHALIQSEDSDLKMGFTHCGPHRADIVLRHNGRSLLDQLSRGQRKLVTIALRLGQLEDFIATTDKGPILYIDDLPAELDKNNRLKVLRRIEGLGIQTLLTGTSRADFMPFESESMTLFHVEQGLISNVI